MPSTPVNASSENEHQSAARIAIRVRQLRAGELDVRIYDDLAELARAAATDAVAALRTAIDARGEANVLLATGNSQLAFLAELVTRRDVDWTAVTAFHMDEYVGLPPGTRRSFQRYIRERVAAHLPLRAFHYLDGTERSRGRSAAVRRPARRAPTRPLLRGHRRERPSRVQRPTGRRLRRSRDRQGDRRSRTRPARQQVEEGHFATIDDVPTRAITVTIPALLAARRVLVIVPESRKAKPVRDTLEAPISTACPATYLRTQSHASLYLDREAAALIDAPS